MTASTLQTLILAGGVLHLGITSAGIVMTLVLDWRRSLAVLCPLTRHIIWAHAIFVLVTIIAFGVVSLACAASLASGEPLARAVCGFIAGFWLLRLTIGFLWFDARPYLTAWPLRVSYYALNMVLAFFVVAYGMGVVR